MKLDGEWVAMVGSEATLRISNDDDDLYRLREGGSADLCNFPSGGAFVGGVDQTEQ